MQETKNVIDCYNKTANNYAHKFGDELNDKHLDKILLSSFAKENSAKGKLIDLGCGPGQTTRFLYDAGMTNVLGVDISGAMVEVASSRHPMVLFETADMLHLQYAGNTFGSAIAFYSIVHFDYSQIKIAFTEIKRILEVGASFLFSFHIGEQVIHLDDFLDHQVNIDFYFFEVNKILELLAEAGFEIVDVIERLPYAGAEHPSRRAYIWANTVTQKS